MDEEDIKALKNNNEYMRKIAIKMSERYMNIVKELNKELND